MPIILAAVIAAISLLLLKSIVRSPKWKLGVQAAGPSSLKFLGVPLFSFDIERSSPTQTSNRNPDPTNRFSDFASASAAKHSRWRVTSPGFEDNASHPSRCTTLAFLCPHKFPTDATGRRQAAEALTRTCREHLALDVATPVVHAIVAPKAASGRICVRVELPADIADVILHRAVALPKGTTIVRWKHGKIRCQEYYQRENRRQYCESGQQPRGQQVVAPPPPPPPDLSELDPDLFKVD